MASNLWLSADFNDIDHEDEECEDCDGTGSVDYMAQTPFGPVDAKRDCPKCGGTGYIEWEDEDYGDKAALDCSRMWP